MTNYRAFTFNGRTQLGYAYQSPTTVEEGKALLTMERDFRRRAGGYKVGDHWFHSDMESKIEQIGLLLMGANVPAIPWKTLKGQEPILSQTLAQQIFQSALTKTMLLFNTAKVKAAELTPENVATYDYFSGWPTCYWEEP